jgi:iron complex transport system substrate-binding protein
MRPVPNPFRSSIGALAIAVLLASGQSTHAAPAVPVGFAQSQAHASRIVTDEVGRQVAIPAQVNRIVSLAPNLTEIVYALGSDSRLVGDTNYCDTPAAAKSKPHVGNPQDPSLEAIVALHPDLVLATASINRVETADALAHVGIPVFTSDPHTVRELLDSIARTGEIIGSPAQGASVAAALHARLDALRARLADRPLAHVLFVVWLDPLQSIGQRTFIADALRWAGSESVVLSDQLWPQITFEEVVRLQPDYIVLVGEHSGVNPADLDDLRSRPGWRDLNAVKLGRVVTMSEEVNRPSPGLIDAIEQLAHDLHPEAFVSQVPSRTQFAVACSPQQDLACAR